MKSKYIVLLCAVVVGSVAASVSGAESLDRLAVVAASKGQTEWRSFLLDGQSRGLLDEGAGAMGVDEGLPVYGPFGSTKKSVVLLAPDRSGVVRLYRQSSGRQESLSLSKGFFALAGGDFDGNGLADVAIVAARGKRRNWQVHFNPWAGVGQSRFSFGRSGDVPFAASYGLGRDWIGLLRPRASGAARRVIVRDVLTGSKARFTLQKAVRRVNLVRAVRIGGQDALFVAAKRRYWVFDFTGALVARGRFSLGASFAVGDFLPEPGDEVVARRQSNDMSVLQLATGVTSVYTTRAGKIVGPVTSGRVATLPQGSSTTNNPGYSGCTSNRSPYDGAGGFLWKDSDHGGLVILTNERYDSMVIVQNGKVIDGPLEYTGVANGNRHHYRNRSRSTGSYPSNIVLVGKRGSQTICWAISNPAGRID